jgi:fructose-1-phosphate kinase PfkB-like protein
MQPFKLVNYMPSPKHQEDDHEMEMAIAQLKSIIKNAQAIHDMIANKQELESWIQSKLTKASDYMTAVHDSLDGKQ